MSARFASFSSSPTARLVAGALVSLIVVSAFAGYTLYSVRRMRQMQVDIVERNRKGSLQLIRIQSDLNALALAMRDMLEHLDGYPLGAWQGQFQRIRGNLDDAVRAESLLTAGNRSPEQTGFLVSSFGDFWRASDAMFQHAAAGDDARARQLIGETLEPRQEALSALVARLLVQNNEQEQQAADQIASIYRGIERNAYLFLAASALLIGAVSWVLIQSNRATLERLTDLSNQRRELAQQLISTQESTFRAISRDLHDEFGQILTALGSMLQRAGRFAPAPEFKEQIQETTQVVQETLERIRGLSQSLQPVILDEQGLEAAIPWHLSVFERQTGIHVDYEQGAPLHEFEPSRAIHIFRILQESLNNVARHAKVQEVFVRSGSNGSVTTLEVEDRGVGIPEVRRNGTGLAAMRERAEILQADLTISKRNGGGTVLRLKVPHG